MRPSPVHTHHGPHSRDLRKGRSSEAGRAYLITAATHERERFFADFHCGRIVVRTMIAEEGRAITMAFVVMPDHLHWLLRLAPDQNLSSVAGDVKSVSSHQINRFLSRRGPVWQDGFHDHALRGNEDLIAMARYLVNNPIRAGLVSKIGDYPLWDAQWLA